MKRLVTWGTLCTLLLGAYGCAEESVRDQTDNTQTTQSAPAPATADFTLWLANADHLEAVAHYDAQNRRFQDFWPNHDETESPREDFEAQKTRLQQTLPAESPYPAFMDGQRVGDFHIEGIEPPGCVAHPQIKGKLSTVTNLPPTGFVYAPPQSFTPWESQTQAPRAPELVEMGEMLKTAFFAQQNLSARSEAFQTDPVRSFPFQKPGQQEAALGLFLRGERKSESSEVVCAQESFWVLGIWEQGRAIPLASGIQPLSEMAEDCQRSEFVGSFNAGEGVDHVVITHHGYEWWDYSIYAWRKDGWEKVYRGGGGGC